MGIIRAFQDLGQQGSTSLRTVRDRDRPSAHRHGDGPVRGHSRGHLLNHVRHGIREIGARMDDFALEFLNLAERSFGE